MMKSPLTNHVHIVSYVNIGFLRVASHASPNVRTLQRLLKKWRMRLKKNKHTIQLNSHVWMHMPMIMLDDIQKLRNIVI